MITCGHPLRNGMTKNKQSVLGRYITARRKSVLSSRMRDNTVKRRQKCFGQGGMFSDRPRHNNWRHSFISTLHNR